MLNCGKHQCAEECHDGPCKPCAVVTEQECHCGKNTKELVCGTNKFFCESVCDKPLDCGNHRCEKLCHKGACEPC